MHISVGAIIYTIINNDIHVLIMHRAHSDTYHFAKGTQEEGETEEQTVLREIKEETNCNVVLEKNLGSILSSFLRYGQVVEKKTIYFRAKYISGELRSNDGEHDTVSFYPLEQISALLEKNGAHTLGYEDEREIVKRFLQSFQE